MKKTFIVLMILLLTALTAIAVDLPVDFPETDLVICLDCYVQDIAIELKFECRSAIEFLESESYQFHNACNNEMLMDKYEREPGINYEMSKWLHSNMMNEMQAIHVEYGNVLPLMNCNRADKYY